MAQPTISINYDISTKALLTPISSIYLNNIYTVTLNIFNVYPSTASYSETAYSFGLGSLDPNVGLLVGATSIDHTNQSTGVIVGVFDLNSEALENDLITHVEDTLEGLTDHKYWIELKAGSPAYTISLFPITILNVILDPS